VDTGATGLALKPSVIKALDLRKATRRISTGSGPAFVNRYEPVRVDLMERYGNFDVVEVPEAVPNLLGQIPPEEMDFVVDPRRQRLIPNPDTAANGWWSFTGGRAVAQLQRRIRRHRSAEFIPLRRINPKFQADAI